MKTGEQITKECEAKINGRNPCLDKKWIDVDSLRSIFYDYIKSAKENCFCSEREKCHNCEGKEYVQDLWKKIEGAKR